MKKGQVVEGVVTRVDFPNKGIVDCEEGICVVKNVIPGQKVRAVINKARKGKAEGRLLEVLESSPIEQESPCSHFGQCGSCIYLSLPYEDSADKRGAGKTPAGACAFQTGRGVEVRRH